MNAEAIKAMWEAKESGSEVPPAALVEAANKAFELEKQVDDLKAAAEKPKSITGALRVALADILQKHKIKAAFEPLIDLALEKYPPGHQLAGQFVCDVDQRIRIWIELLQYQMPKLRAIEVAGEIDNHLTITIKKFGAGDEVARPLAQATGVPIDVPAVVTHDEGPSIKIKKF